MRARYTHARAQRCGVVWSYWFNVGRLIRLTEPHFHLVECFDKEANTCPITPVCGLKSTLRSALDAYLHVLDRYWLADFLPPRRSY